MDMGDYLLSDGNLFYDLDDYLDLPVVCFTGGGVYIMIGFSFLLKSLGL
jgi:hypothetical protein